MKKVMPLLIIIVIIAGFVYYYMLKEEEGFNGNSSIISDKRIVEISKSPVDMLEFVYSIQEEPSQVMKTYNILRKLIYSNEYKGVKLERLVKMQRALYHPELLSQNQFDLHLMAIESDLGKWKEAEFKIIGSDMLSPSYAGEENQICFIKVIYYTNDPEKDKDIYVNYELLKDDNNLWKVLAWKDIEPFEIIK